MCSLNANIDIVSDKKREVETTIKNWSLYTKAIDEYFENNSNVELLLPVLEKMDNFTLKFYDIYPEYTPWSYLSFPQDYENTNISDIRISTKEQNDDRTTVFFQWNTNWLPEWKFIMCIWIYPELRIGKKEWPNTRSCREDQWWQNLHNITISSKNEWNHKVKFSLYNDENRPWSLVSEPIYELYWEEFSLSK